jgi:hypothetical protein
MAANVLAALEMRGRAGPAEGAMPGSVDVLVTRMTLKGPSVWRWRQGNPNR